MEELKGFIEVHIEYRDDYFKKSININHIITFENNYINTSRILSGYHTKTSYTEGVLVKESYEEIKQLIKNAQ